MSKVVVNELVGQFQHAIAIFYGGVGRFTEQWVVEFEFSQVPARHASHLLECLGFYIAGKPVEGYPWGIRFGGGWDL